MCVSDDDKSLHRGPNKLLAIIDYLRRSDMNKTEKGNAINEIKIFSHSPDFRSSQNGISGPKK